MNETAFGIKLLAVGMSSVPILGRIARIEDDGRAFVEYPGSCGPVAARCAAAESDIPSRAALPGADVLLLFEDEVLRRPVIVGFVRDALWTQRTPEPQIASPTGALTLEGQQEVVLRCGKGSISMTADGRIVIKGTRITSRATETNKVRGAVVLIN